MIDGTCGGFFVPGKKMSPIHLCKQTGPHNILIFNKADAYFKYEARNHCWVEAL